MHWSCAHRKLSLKGSRSRRIKKYWELGGFFRIKAGKNFLTSFFSKKHIVPIGCLQNFS